MRSLAALALAALALPAFAHDGVDHDSAEEAAQHLAETAGPPPVPQGLPLPFNLGGAFTLTDQTGSARSEADPEGAFQLLFFGYANCPSICAVALPLMGEVTDALRDRGLSVTPVMITVDPGPRHRGKHRRTPLARRSTPISWVSPAPRPTSTRSTNSSPWKRRWCSKTR